MISIVIPTYKRPDFLDRLLKSIEKQTFKNFEVIVVDDNSPNYEEYLPVIKKYKKIFKEFKFLRNTENKGAPYSRNRGIKEAKYDLIALVDDDDEWLPKKLEMQFEVFKNSNENLGLVYTWADAIDEKGRIVYKYRSEIEGNPRKEILKECFIPSPSVMVRKKAIIEAGLFDERMPSCQDWDMWTRIIMKDYSIKVVKDIVTIYHKHGRESIGLSKKAKIGYRIFYKKNIKYGIHPLLKYLRRLFR
ncbi:glycosyltransferase family 2 protein [Hippea jasoniae]|uniref:glycosyltransferase family 2 protein n=1 Tax=Hippea jasoniae TaxID=944479 RepID=UPI0006896758|nr:glycosyltransferase family A protein [Hippea jasoniae]